MFKKIPSRTFLIRSILETLQMSEICLSSNQSVSETGYNLVQIIVTC